MRHMGTGGLLLGLIFGGFILPGAAVADPPTLEEYLLSFDYADRREMRDEREPEVAAATLSPRLSLSTIKGRYRTKIAIYLGPAVGVADNGGGPI